MAKRKLYEEKLVEEKYSDDIVNGILIESRLIPITEEEIVRPYLEKLKEEIQKEENILYHDCEADFSKSYAVIRTDTVIELIDNLLTEKGAEE